MTVILMLKRRLCYCLKQFCERIPTRSYRNKWIDQQLFELIVKHNIIVQSLLFFVSTIADMFYFFLTFQARHIVRLVFLQKSVILLLKRIEQKLQCLQNVIFPKEANEVGTAYKGLSSTARVNFVRKFLSKLLILNTSEKSFFRGQSETWLKHMVMALVYFYLLIFNYNPVMASPFSFTNRQKFLTILFR